MVEAPHIVENHVEAGAVRVLEPIYIPESDRLFTFHQEHNGGY